MEPISCPNCKNCILAYANEKPGCNEFNCTRERFDLFIKQEILGHERRIFYLLKKRVRIRDQDIEDAVGQAFLNVHEHMMKNGGIPNRSFFLKVAENLCLDMLRSKGKKNELPESSLSEEQVRAIRGRFGKKEDYDF